MRVIARHSLLMQALWTEIGAPFLALLALSASLVGVLLALCLLARPQPTLAYLQGMNRWVSSRRVLKPLEVQRSLGPRVRGRRLWLGLVLTAIGVYALVVLVRYVDAANLTRALGADPRYSVTGLVVDWLRWVLVLGAAVCVGVGLMTALAPRLLEGFEAWANTWVSSRRALQGADTMYLPLDRLVAQFPRASALLLFLLSAAALAASVLLLLKS